MHLPPKPPRPFHVGDRVRTKASTTRSGPLVTGRVLELRDDLALVAFDGNDPEGSWCRASGLEIETP